MCLRNVLMLCAVFAIWCPRARAEKVVIAAPTANVMGDNKILGQVRQGTEVTVEQRHGSYILITIPGTRIRGWVNKDATGTMMTDEEFHRDRGLALQKFREATTDEAKLAAALESLDYERFAVQYVERLLELNPNGADGLAAADSCRESLIVNCEWVVGLREKLGKPDDSLPLLNEIAKVSADRWGREDYRSVDARLAVVDAQASKVRTPEQQSQLMRARQLQAEADEEIAAKEDAAATSHAQEAADLRRAVLGAQHPDYAQCVMTLGRASRGRKTSRKRSRSSSRPSESGKPPWARGTPNTRTACMNWPGRNSNSAMSTLPNATTTNPCASAGKCTARIILIASTLCWDSQTSIRIGKTRSRLKNIWTSRIGFSRRSRPRGNGNLIPSRWILSGRHEMRTGGSGFLCVLVLWTCPGMGWAQQVVVSSPFAPVKGDNRSLGRLAQGTAISVESRSGSWLLVTLPGSTVRGWISEQDVRSGAAAAGLERLPDDVDELFALRDKTAKQLEAAPNDAARAPLERRLMQVDRKLIMDLENHLATSPETFTPEHAKQMRDGLNEWFALDAIDVANRAWEAKRWSEAAGLYQEIVEASTAKWGVDFYFTRDARCRSGESQAALRRPKTEQAEVERAAELNAETERLSDAGDYSQALLVIQQAVEIRRQRLGTSHFQYGQSRVLEGSILTSLSRFAEAEGPIREGLQALEQTLGRQHRDYTNTLSVLGMLYGDQGDYVRRKRRSRSPLRSSRPPAEREQQTTPRR